MSTCSHSLKELRGRLSVYEALNGRTICAAIFLVLFVLSLLLSLLSDCGCEHCELSACYPAVAKTHFTDSGRVVIKVKWVLVADVQQRPFCRQCTQIGGKTVQQIEIQISLMQMLYSTLSTVQSHIMQSDGLSAQRCPVLHRRGVR